MQYVLKPIEKLARELGKLPGIGLKTATRLAFHVVEMDAGIVDNLSKALGDVKAAIKTCEICFSYTHDSVLCHACSDPGREPGIICVVEKPQDVFAFERGGFRGLYHVLHGVISPLDGVGQDDIRIRELVDRARRQGIREVIIALNSSVEGDATTLYIARILGAMNIKVSRLARGVPAGASIDYVDDITLIRAMEERQKVSC